MPNLRMDRINEEMKKAVSEIIHSQMKDPRLSSGLYSVTSAEVTKDLKHAVITISVLGKEQDREVILTLLQNASGFIGRELGRKLDIKRIPMLHFKPDTSIEYSIYISKVIDSVTGENE
ncbi:MAG: 30S ribosome-binding factor RbfA [Christensenellales bacterium]